MPPKSKALEEALEAIVREMYIGGERGTITVNAVRNRVQDQFDLEDGFFLSSTWKAKSKDIIRKTMSQLEDEAEAKPEPVPLKTQSESRDSKNGVKRESTDAEDAPSKKRQKKESTSPPPKTAKKRESSSELSELSDLSNAEDTKSTRKRKVTKRAATTRKKIKRAVDSDEEEAVKTESSEDEKDFKDESGSEEDIKPKKTAVKRAAPKRTIKKAASSGSEDDVKPKKKVARHAAPKKKTKTEAVSDDEPDNLKIESGDDARVKEDADSEGESKAKKESDDSAIHLAEPQPAKQEAKQEPKQEDDSESPLSDVKENFSDDDKKKGPVTYESDSDMSVVHDELPKTKGKAKAAAEPKVKKGAKTSESKKPSATAAASPDDAEIKKLQGQLVKCGVRKIWQFELKEHGDNAKAKIKHLKGMLRDIGMGGRFSESKAREIKEMRELAADIEAVQEMDKNWGVGGRQSRSRAAAARNKKAKKEESEEEVSDGENKDINVKADDEDDSGSEVKVAAKSRRAAKLHADLAFLGDESESD